MVSLTLKNQRIRDSLMNNLKKENIETRPFFKKISSMPFYEEANNKVSSKLSEIGLNVPSYPQLKKADIKFISNKIKHFLNINL